MGRRPLAAPIAIAAISGWILVVAFYAVVFALAGAPIPMAIRGAFANGVPDGLLALAVFGTARRLDAPKTGAGGLLRTHTLRALLLVGLAFAAKTALLWVDVTLIRAKEPFRLVPTIVAWQIFVSVLIYLASAAASHLVLTDRRLREEEARAARAEALRARAELSALRAQLNPHFVFNVLHSVLGMVRGDPALAEAALEGLGDLLRYALRVHRDGVDRTALRHEWEFMETYLGLEKIRLGDRLQIDRRAGDDALDASVPTFSLQPLVENAVRHGIASRAAGGKISVDARIEGDALRLEVSNDGDGRGAALTDDEGGVGLRVLRDRLEVLYRGRARMTAGPTDEGGYRVVLILPGAPNEAEAET
ncbi:MAG TPA: histidine kinase [Gemmatimonadales bacterium]|nr:histidine kinase [Gemmatimonadales bacterium]